jgi:hypothetical protein
MNGLMQPAHVVHPLIALFNIAGQEGRVKGGALNALVKMVIGGWGPKNTEQIGKNIQHQGFAGRHRPNY